MRLGTRRYFHHGQLESDEPLEYLATQAVAEYVRDRRGLDGLIYRSETGSVSSHLGSRTIKVVHSEELPLFRDRSCDVSQQLNDTLQRCNVALLGQGRRRRQRQSRRR